MKIYKIVFFIFLTIFLLSLLCVFFPKEGLAVGNQRFFFPTLEEVMIREQSSSAGEKMRELEESLRMQVYQDSLARAEKRAEWTAYQDSLRFYTNFFKNNPARIYLPGNNHSFFSPLFEEFEHLEKTKDLIHILHYGDSQIEGDRITGSLRQKLQEKFGGNGAGLIPLVQPIPSAAVAQSASENLGRFIIAGNHQNRANHNRYGILGQVAHVYGSANASVGARNWKATYENVKQFSKVRFFVNNNSENFTVTLTPNGKEGIPKSIPEIKNSVSVLTWDFASPIRSFSLNIKGSGEVLGISLDGNSGLTIDNIPLRGSSGTFFTAIDSQTMTPIMEELKVRLIILQFGGNMVPMMTGEKVIANYKSSIIKQINYFKRIYPQATILLIGPSDMSKRVNGRLQTYPNLPETVQAMKEAALESGAAFWNMFQVMGGENSMIDWVNEKPALASPDYIHFTPAGAERIADVFYESLMIYYDYYKFIQNSKVEKPEE